MRTELPSFEDIDDTKKRIAIQYSLPKWIVDHWVTFWSRKTENIARSFRACNHNRAPIYLVILLIQLSLS